jgi:hypothetical protein
MSAVAGLGPVGDVGNHIALVHAKGGWEMKALLSRCYSTCFSVVSLLERPKRLPTIRNFQFVHDINNAAASLTNDAFQAPINATVLSLDHAFTLGAANPDTLFVNIGHTTCAFKLEQSGSDHFQLVCLVLSRTAELSFSSIFGVRSTAFPGEATTIAAALGAILTLETAR